MLVQDRIPYILREFGIRDVRYVNYRVALVGEIAIRFLPKSYSRRHCILSRIHVTFDTSLARSRRFITQPITATNSPFLPPNAIFHASPDKLL